MHLERKIVSGKLIITIEGTILNNLGGIRGINPRDPYPKKKVKATRVYYLSRRGFPSLIFHKDLPLDIEGRRFRYKGVYLGENESNIPIRQRMSVYREGEQKPERIFRFP
jgi:hypothetical protein